MSKCSLCPYLVECSENDHELTCEEVFALEAEKGKEKQQNIDK